VTKHRFHTDIED